MDHRHIHGYLVMPKAFTVGVKCFILRNSIAVYWCHHHQHLFLFSYYFYILNLPFNLALPEHGKPLSPLPSPSHETQSASSTNGQLELIN